MNFLRAQVNWSSLHSSGPSKGICLICPVAFGFQPEAPELRPFPLPLWPILSRNLSSAYFWRQMLPAALGEQDQFYQTSLTFVLGWVYMQSIWPYPPWKLEQTKLRTREPKITQFYFISLQWPYSSLYFLLAFDRQRKPFHCQCVHFCL